MRGADPHRIELTFGSDANRPVTNTGRLAYAELISLAGEMREAEIALTCVRGAQNQKDSLTMLAEMNRLINEPTELAKVWKARLVARLLEE